MSRASGEPPVQRRRRGFSLVEVLVTSALFLVVMAGVYLLYTTMQGTLTRGEMKSDLQQNARVGMDRMVQELRMAGYDPENALGTVSPQPYNEIRAAATGCVAFVTYRRQAGSDRTVQVAYRLGGTTGSTLERREDDWNPAGSVFTAPPGWEPLAESVSRLAFIYYDAFNRILKPSGAASAGCPPGSTPVVDVLDAMQASQVRRVAITLRTLETRPRTPPESYTLTSHVYLRNR